MTPRGNPASPDFVRELYRTMRHLYDPTELRRSQLIDLLGLSKSVDPVGAAQRALLQAIEALKPSSNVPPHANAWRMYHILNQRYAGQFEMSDVAANLAISGRQLRRLQALALQALGDYLCNRYGLEPRVTTTGGEGTSESPESKAPVPRVPTREQELGRLRSFEAGEPVEVVDAVEGALVVARPLIAASNVRVDTQVPPGLPSIAANATAMRHALLSVLTAAVRAAAGGSIVISAQSTAQHVRIDVCATADRSGGSFPLTTRQVAAQQKENLDIATQLVTLFGGSVDVVPGSGRHEPLAVRLSLPAVEQLPVLVIEDSADTLRLFERYLTGSRYRFVGVQDPRQAVEVAAQVQPRAIVLDLMLPVVDGWEILGRLREHPRTGGVPILVCTILPHEDLALALGAAGLIRKPVSQPDFLSALDRQFGPVPASPILQTSC